MRDHRDLVIEDLALEVATLRAQLSEVEAQRDGWRRVAAHAIDEASARHRELEMCRPSRYVHQKHMAAQQPNATRRRQEVA
jgi:hypothetical protein